MNQIRSHIRTGWILTMKYNYKKTTYYNVVCIAQCSYHIRIQMVSQNTEYISGLPDFDLFRAS